MEYVIISGGVAQDMTKGVSVLDLDNLREETDLDTLAEAYRTAADSGIAWVITEVLGILARHGATVCTQCGDWLVPHADAPNGYVDGDESEMCEEAGVPSLHEAAVSL